MGDLAGYNERLVEYRRAMLDNPHKDTVCLRAKHGKLFDRENITKFCAGYVECFDFFLFSFIVLLLLHGMIYICYYIDV